MTRVSNFFFDLMVVAGVAAIRLDILGNYWAIILFLGLIGAIITYIYNRIVAKTLFGDYVEEQFLTMYGMLTGTASTGIILLREIDSDFKTPASDNMVYQNFFAIVLGLPMMFLATLAPKHPYLTFAIFVFLKEDTIKYTISFNGKARFTLDFPADADNDTIQSTVMGYELAQKWIDGKTPKKVIIVPKKIVNVVL